MEDTTGGRRYENRSISIEPTDETGFQRTCATDEDIDTVVASTNVSLEEQAALRAILIKYRELFTNYPGRIRGFTYCIEVDIDEAIMKTTVLNSYVSLASGAEED